MMLLLLLSGPVAERLGGLIGLGEAALRLWQAARIPALLLLLVFVIALLLWIWIMHIVLLAGAELNAEIERGRQLQAGIEAAEKLRPPPRDLRGVRRLQAKEQELVEEGRALRRRHSGPDPTEHASAGDGAAPA